MPNPEADLIAAVHAWDRAMVSNDPVAIGQFVADDWVIIGPDGSVDGRERFLGLIASGDLSHDVMESHELRVRLFGDVALVISRGISGGNFRGAPFRLEERVSCVFRHHAGQWRCQSTHLSLIANRSPG